MTVMPTDQDDKQVIDTTSTSNDQGTSADNLPAAKDNGTNADLPPADGKKPESLVDRVKSALEQSGSPEDASSQSKDGKTAEADPAKPQGEGEGDDKDFTQEEINRLHSRTRKEFNKLLTRNREMGEKLKTAEPAAAEYQKITQFLKDNRISNDDADAAFQLLADINRDPAKALAALEPLVDQLRQVTGAVLPQDLQQQVEQGYITEEAAKETAKLRADKARRDQADKDADQRKRDDERQKQVATAGKVKTTIAEWETKWKSNDPDYSKKQKKVADAFELAMARAAQNKTLPSTPEEVVKLLETCRKAVESELQEYQPRRQEIRHVTGNSAPSAQPQAKSLQEAIMRRVNG